MRPHNPEQLLGSLKYNPSFISWTKSIANNTRLQSCLFWGPPGTGKTTTAKLIIKLRNTKFIALQAFDCGVKDLRAAIKDLSSGHKPGILFIDEIHNLNKSQQDTLLQSIEIGKITLIGATTENPNITINKALLSRLIKFELKPLTRKDLKELLCRAKETLKLNINEEIEKRLLKVAQGDARNLLNQLEHILNTKSASSKNENSQITINLEDCEGLLNNQIFDADDNSYYDYVSALQKSIRGSDANAAIFWLAKLLSGGADLKSICRRILITASEDIGLADNNAIVIVNNAVDIALKVGMPEARILLAQAVIYIAEAPKSNKAYKAISKAMQLLEHYSNVNTPNHLRSKPAQDKSGQQYIYTHDYPNLPQEFLPEEIRNIKFFDNKRN